MELILSRPPESDRLYFEQALRTGLAGARIPLRHSQPKPQKRLSPEDLARAIRTAVGRGVAGLVVEPIDDAVVVDALYDAVGRGTAVLLLDQGVPARGGKSIPRVEFIGFADVGRQVVAAALEIERNLNPAKPGRIVLLHHRSDDPYLERGYQSLLKPCQASGKPMQILEFEGDPDQGVAVLQKSLEAAPDTGIVLADDMAGINAGFVIRVERVKSGRPKFVLAGYTPNDYRDVTFLDLVDAIGERSVGSYASKATLAIRNLMEGKKVPDVVEVPVAFHQSAPERRSEGNETAPHPKKPRRKTLTATVWSAFQGSGFMRLGSGFQTPPPAVSDAGIGKTAPTKAAAPRLSAVDVAMLSAWCGLAGGLLEVGTRVVCKMAPGHRMYGMSRHFIWMVPLSSLLLFSGIGLMLGDGDEVLASSRRVALLEAGLFLGDPTHAHRDQPQDLSVGLGDPGRRDLKSPGADPRAPSDRDAALADA